MESHSGFILVIFLVGVLIAEHETTGSLEEDRSAWLHMAKAGSGRLLNKDRDSSIMSSKQIIRVKRQSARNISFHCYDLTHHIIRCHKLANTNRPTLMPPFATTPAVQRPAVTKRPTTVNPPFATTPVVQRPAVTTVSPQVPHHTHPPATKIFQPTTPYHHVPSRAPTKTHPAILTPTTGHHHPVVSQKTTGHHQTPSSSTVLLQSLSTQRPGPHFSTTRSYRTFRTYTFPITTKPWWWPGPAPPSTTPRAPKETNILLYVIPAVFGVLIICLVIAVCCCIYCRRRKPTYKKHADEENDIKRSPQGSVSKSRPVEGSLRSSSKGGSTRKVPLESEDIIIVPLQDLSYAVKEEEESDDEDKKSIKDDYGVAMSYHKSLRALPQVTSLTLKNEFNEEPPPSYSSVSLDPTGSGNSKKHRNSTNTKSQTQKGSKAPSVKEKGIEGTSQKSRSSGSKRQGGSKRVSKTPVQQNKENEQKAGIGDKGDIKSKSLRKSSNSKQTSTKSRSSSTGRDKTARQSSTTSTKSLNK